MTYSHRRPAQFRLQNSATKFRNACWLMQRYWSIPSSN